MEQITTIIDGREYAGSLFVMPCCNGRKGMFTVTYGTDIWKDKSVLPMYMIPFWAEDELRKLVLKQITPTSPSRRENP
jgi:hypothetical protein